MLVRERKEVQALPWEIIWFQEFLEMKTVDVVSLREVLGSLDNAHGELVHSMLFQRFIQTGIFEKIDPNKTNRYRKLCFCFFKATGQMLPVLADYSCVLLAGLASREIAETGKHARYDEAEKMIWRLSTRHVRKGRATSLAEVLNRAYSQHLPANDMEETMNTILPVVKETGRLVIAKEYHLAIGNFTVLFRVLHKLYVWCPEMFAENNPGMGCNLSLISEMTRKLFCKMRGTDGLPADLADELDSMAVVKNARYNNFFGAWDSTEFKDMVSGAGHQSHDYALCEAEPVFDTLA